MFDHGQTRPERSPIEPKIGSIRFGLTMSSQTSCWASFDHDQIIPKGVSTQIYIELGSAVAKLCLKEV